MTSLIAAGTLKAQFDDETSERVRDTALLGRALDELQVPSHRVWTIERVLEVLDAPSPAVERAARLAACAVVAAISQGSTGVPLEADRPGSGLHALLETLLETVHRLDESGNALRVDAGEVADEFRAALGAGALDALVGRPGDYRPLIVDRGALYTHQTATMEASVAAKIARMLDGASGVEAAAAGRHAEAVLSAMPFDIDGAERAEKHDVLDNVLPRRFSVVSGGAGSGKTTIVLSILRVLDLLDDVDGGLEPGDIALAAPTGKAAKRLWESIEDQVEGVRTRHVDGPNAELAARLVALRDGLEPPRTLHRLLRYSPHFKTFRRNADSPLDAKLVVVDEASMVDLSLMDALLSALGDDARLLLVGDAGQLPAVQAGAVFHDLSATDADGRRLPCTSVLAHNFRVQTGGGDDPARHILTVSEQVRDASEATALSAFVSEGVVEAASTVRDAPGVHWIDADATGEAALDDFLDQWWHTHLAYLAPEGLHRNRTHFAQTEDGGFVDEATATLDELFAAAERAQLLCITRVADTGSNWLNYRLQRRFSSTHGLQDPDRFEAGEPVMVTRNDYDAGVFNGDQGVVLYTLRPDEQADDSQNAKKRVVFRDADGFRAVSLGRIRDKLEHAYALTVHKSQGSEYDHVGIVLPELLEVANSADQTVVHPLMTREILYTAITRAKASVTLHGAARVFDEGAARSAGRYSGVRARLPLPDSGRRRASFARRRGLQLRKDPN